MGPFKSLHEILEVDSLSEKVLKQICNDIILNNEDMDKKVTREVNAKPRKSAKQLVIPGFESNSVRG